MKFVPLQSEKLVRYWRKAQPRDHCQNLCRFTDLILLVLAISGMIPFLLGGDTVSASQEEYGTSIKETTLLNPWGGDWVVDGPIGGNIAALIIHPTDSRLIFAGTDDGTIYKSDDQGNTWRELKPGLGIRGVSIACLTFYPANPDIIYAGTIKIWNDGGLFRSLDP
jgi:hypothetical protein